MQSIETGLVYLRARWYDPASGTFLSRDPFAGYPTIPTRSIRISTPIAIRGGGRTRVGRVCRMLKRDVFGYGKPTPISLGLIQGHIIGLMGKPT
ncbi:hypothetical protein HC928_12720 [bacterium]|nr:hypothetical protein [bacterium]